MVERRSWLALATYGAVLLATGRALAQSQNLAVVQVRGTDPGTTFEIARPGLSSTRARCANPCQITAPQGKYELHVYRGDRELGTAGLKLTGPASFEVSPPNLERQKMGLTLGITGSAFFLAGLVAVAYGTSERHRCGLDAACRDRYESTLWYGAGAAVLGGILSPIGWVLYGTSRSPKVRVLPASQGSRDFSLRAAVTF